VQYCQEFAYHLRWLRFAAGDCANLTQARVELMSALTFQMSQFVQPVSFGNEDGSAKRVELVVQEVQNIIREQFTESRDPH